MFVFKIITLLIFLSLIMMVNFYVFLIIITLGKPTIAYFYIDHNGKHMNVCYIDLEEKELSTPLWSKRKVF